MGKKKRGGHDPELELPRWPVKDDKVCVRFSSKNIDPDSKCRGTCWYDGVVVEGEPHSTDLTVQFRDEVAPYVIDFLGKSKKDWEFFENWETSAKRGPAKKKARQKAAPLQKAKQKPKQKAKQKKPPPPKPKKKAKAKTNAKAKKKKKPKTFANRCRDGSAALPRFHPYAYEGQAVPGKHRAEFNYVRGMYPMKAGGPGSSASVGDWRGAMGLLSAPHAEIGAKFGGGPCVRHRA